MLLARLRRDIAQASWKKMPSICQSEGIEAARAQACRFIWAALTRLRYVRSNEATRQISQFACSCCW